MRSYFDILTQVITGVRGQSQKDLNAVTRKLHKEFVE